MRGNKIDIIPAVDIKGGRCVRLSQGKFDTETVFSEDPIEAALKWQSLGAPRLHVIDLDGAATGELGNYEIIKEMAATIIVPIQVGGGIRNIETVVQLLKAGVERIILGTAAVENPMLVEEACHKFGESIIVGLDTRDGFISTRGWQMDTRITALEVAKNMTKLGVKRFIFTDISRDGMLTEPNFTAIYDLADALRVPVIASGGISTLTHLKIIKHLGVEGVIVGKALYTGNISLKEALAINN